MTKRVWSELLVASVDGHLLSLYLQDAVTDKVPADALPIPTLERVSVASYQKKMEDSENRKLESYFTDKQRAGNFVFRQLQTQVMTDGVSSFKSQWKEW